MGQKTKYQITKKGQGQVDNYLTSVIGRPCEYSEQIGQFICIHIALGWTVEKTVSKFNNLVGEKILSRVKIYRWLKNDKLKDFNDKWNRARELATEGILDKIMGIEEDVQNLTLDGKNARVILESLRWRAKVQNPDYFNPADKSINKHEHEFVIKSQVPEPRPVIEDDIIDAEYQESDG